ncbi:MAG: acetylglutamate kinase [Chloroflexi bacterium]|nr:acetylglutamate kinase [Chloroflexota bacterium]
MNPQSNIQDAVRPVVIKLGGAALPHRDAVLEDLRAVRRAGFQLILVHGGGPVISEWLKRVGKEPVFVNGLRQTDAETLEIAIMALAGKVNKELVAVLQQGDTPAVGICGVDGGFIRARRQANPDIGFVGEVAGVDPRPLEALAAAGYVPVIAPIALGPDGPLNINADTVAGDIAGAAGATSLIFLTDVPGVKDRAGSVLPALDRAAVEALKRDGTISGGMIPKVDACLSALDRVPRTSTVAIVDGGHPHAIVEHVLHGRTHGTLFTG